MRKTQCGREAAPTAPRPETARLVSKPLFLTPPAASAQYRHCGAIGIASADYAALVIGVRCNLSPAVARRVVELVGIGGDA